MTRFAIFDKRGVRRPRRSRLEDAVIVVTCFVVVLFSCVVVAATLALGCDASGGDDVLACRFMRWMPSPQASLAVLAAAPLVTLVAGLRALHTNRWHSFAFTFAFCFGGLWLLELSFRV